MSYQLQKIVIYPVKSLGGIGLTQARVGDRGLQYDRRYMLVDSNGLFITQRKFPQLSQIKMMQHAGGFIATYRNNNRDNKIEIPFEPEYHGFIEATVWDDVFVVSLTDPVYSEFFSDFLKMDVRLVYMPDSTSRFYNTPKIVNHGITSLADAYPLLLIGTASLDDLNSKLDTPVCMDRFRPNLIVSTQVPFEEDNFGQFRIAGQHFISVKQCSRCIMTTVDTSTGIMGKEPLKTLSAYRMIGNKVMFGMNIAPVGHNSTLSCGDHLFVDRQQ